jgi:hypothetical protein
VLHLFFEFYLHLKVCLPFQVVVDQDHLAANLVWGAALSMCIADAAGGPVYFEVSAGGPDGRVSETSDELELSPLNSRPVGQDLFSWAVFLLTLSVIVLKSSSQNSFGFL